MLLLQRAGGRAVARLGARTRAMAAPALGARPRSLMPPLRPPPASPLLLSSPGRPRRLACSAATAATPPPPPPSSSSSQQQRSKFCRHCGASPMQFRVPEGDTHPREVCGACGAVEYRNPRLVVGAIVARGPHLSEVLLCRRAIEPQLGRWTLPAGYLEVGESTAEGAAREVLEETGAEVRVVKPFAHFDVPMIGQAYLLFLARAVDGPRGEPRASTPESLETRWFSVVEEEEGQAVPWSELAFSSVETALRLFREDVRAAATTMAAADFRQHHGVIERQKGAGPNDAGTYFLRDHTWTGGRAGTGGGRGGGA